MKFFALFLIACFLAGFVLQGRPAARFWFAAALSLSLVVLFFYFGKI